MMSRRLVRLPQDPQVRRTSPSHAGRLLGLLLLVLAVLCSQDHGNWVSTAVASVTPKRIGNAGDGVTSAGTNRSVAREVQLRQRYRALPMSFEPNVGQTDEQVQFISRGAGYTLFITHEGAVLSLEQRTAEAKEVLDPSRLEAPQRGEISAVLHMQLLSANPQARANGINELSGKTNYIRGNDPKKWKTGVANYAKVRYEDIYPGVDLLYSGDHGQLEYDFIVAPGAKNSAIAMNFPGARRIFVEKATGDLVVSAGQSEVHFHKPLAYQLVSDSGDLMQSLSASEKHIIPAKYVIDAHRRVTFEIAAYDHRKPLIIDPAVSYSTYFGGSASDYATSLAVDAAGDVYVVGYTGSTNFPVTSGAYQTSCGNGCANNSLDGFITKFDPTGSSLIYSTYLGGNLTDYINGIALDAAGDAYLVGQTFSSNFPVTPGAFQPACGGSVCSGGEAFVTELNSSGSALVYSTYLGGSSKNQANAIALDSSGDAFITGWTQSTDFPVTAGAFKTSCDCSSHPDAIVTELNPSGTALVYSTYLGGSVADVGYGIVLNSSGNAYVTGYTQSTDFPVTVGAYQTTTGANSAAFVTELNSTGTGLVYSTYLGGSSMLTTTPCEACATSLAIDSAGNVYVTGLTAESDFPVTPGAFQSTLKSSSKGHNAFITELNPTGTSIIYSTYLGGTQDTGATGIAVDPSGNVWLKGNTKSTDFPVTSGSFQTASGGNFDFFVSELNPGGTSLLYSTYIGGSDVEYGGATGTLTIDSQDPPNVYVTGYTASTNFPTTAGTFQGTSAGLNDAIVMKFVPSPNVGLAPSSLNFGSVLVGTTSTSQTVTLTNTGNLQLDTPTITLTGTNSGDFSQSNTCTGSLAPQGTCTITVQFSPTLFAAESASVSISDNAPNNPQTIPLSGTGIPAGPAVTLSPASLTFPTTKLKTRSMPQTVTLTNTGTATLSVTSVKTTGDFNQSNTCTSVAVGASCTITVTFMPTQINTRSGTVTITDNASNSPQTIPLSGVGTSVQLQPASLNFGTVAFGSMSTKTVTLTNLGTTALNISSISITGTNPQDFSQTNTCGRVVSGGAECTISVTFKPTIKGLRSASLSISDNGGASPQSVMLVGSCQ